MTKQWQPKLQPGRQPIYLALTEAIADDITSGTLTEEMRLPTHRELADTLGVAIGTITRAYAEAEKRGLIRGEGRRGTFVGESGRRSSSFLSPYGKDTGFIDLSNFYPAVGDDPDLISALRRLARQRQTQWLLQYTEPCGLDHHRAAGADWIRRLGMEVSPDSLVITCGAQHAVSLILTTITKQGDLLLTEAYTYPGIRGLAELLGIHLSGVPMDENGPLPDALDSICSREKVCAFYCNPTLHNPTSITVPEARRREIAAVAGKHGIYIIEDEISRAMASDPPPLISSIAPDRSFLIASVSKVVAGGLRTCFVAPPPELLQPLLGAVCATTYMAPPLLLEIFALWMKDGTIQKTIRKRRNEAIVRQRLVKTVLGSFSMKTDPASYFVWMSLPDTWTAKELVAEARLRGIGLAPAEVFAIDRSKPVNAVRICLGGGTSRGTLKSALETVADILEKPAQDNFPTI